MIAKLKYYDDYDYECLKIEFVSSVDIIGGQEGKHQKNVLNVNQDYGI